MTKDELLLENLKTVLRVWRKKDDVLEYLYYLGIRMNEREFRRYVANFNENYYSGETELFIAHSNSKGYILTTDKDIINLSLNDDYKRAMKLLRRYWKCKKAQSEKTQISLSPSELNEYEIVMRLENA